MMAHMLNHWTLIFLLFNSFFTLAVELGNLSGSSLNTLFSATIDHSIDDEYKSTDIVNSYILAESVPVKDNIPYGSMLGYRFKPNMSAEFTHSYQIIIYLSASLCQLPVNWNTSISNNGLTLYYTFNETIANNTDFRNMEKVDFQGGYASAIAETEIISTDSDYMLYLMIQPQQCNNCTADDIWVYEFAASQRKVMFLYDTEPRISVLDVDYEAAIFQTDDIPFGQNSSYSLYLFKDEYPIPIGLNQSWCAISENQQYDKKISVNESLVASLKNAFVVSDLDIAKTYTGVLVITNDIIPYGGGIFEPFVFTMSKTRSCKLAYGLEFCDEVAYAVPISESYLYGKESWSEFVSSYDNYSESLYQPFEYALQQVACDTELDARYSPIRTCNDCKYSYKQWLCAVTIPRCVSSLNSGVFNLNYTAEQGRNEYIAEHIKPPLPYSEILPCLNVCQAIVRDCPADFGFGCPETPEQVQLSYGDQELLKGNSDADDTDDDESNAIAELVRETLFDGSIQTYRLCNYLGVSNIYTSSSSAEATSSAST
ncbi:unnamed protein product [Pichia kudriavzevii]